MAHESPAIDQHCVSIVRTAGPVPLLADVLQPYQRQTRLGLGLGLGFFGIDVVGEVDPFFPQQNVE